MPFSKAAAARFQTATVWHWSRRRALQSISQDGVCMMGSTCGLVHMKHGDNNLLDAVSSSPVCCSD